MPQFIILCMFSCTPVFAVWISLKNAKIALSFDLGECHFHHLIWPGTRIMTLFLFLLRIILYTGKAIFLYWFDFIVLIKQLQDQTISMDIRESSKSTQFIMEQTIERKMGEATNKKARTHTHTWGCATSKLGMFLPVTAELASSFIAFKSQRYSCCSCTFCLRPLTLFPTSIIIQIFI